MTPPDTVACPPWCEQHVDSGFGWVHARTLVEDELAGLRVFLSYGGVFDGGPGEVVPMLEVEGRGGPCGNVEHFAVTATPELLASFARVAAAADVV